jgi:hypothetical protein
MVTADLEISRDGKSLGHMYPARWFFFGKEDQPTTEVALRRGVAQDLYLVLAAYDPGTPDSDAPGHVNR